MAFSAIGQDIMRILLMQLFLDFLLVYLLKRDMGLMGNIISDYYAGSLMVARWFGKQNVTQIRGKCLDVLVKKADLRNLN